MHRNARDSELLLIAALALEVEELGGVTELVGLGGDLGGLRGRRWGRPLRNKKV